MPIDAGIIGQLRPVQAPDEMNMLAKVLAIKDAQQNQQVNSLKLQEMQRGIEDQNALRQALSQPGADPYNALLSRGRVKEATDYAKGQADIGKTKAETDAKAVEAAHKRVDAWGQAMGFVRQNPTPENAVSAVQHLVTMGIIPQDKAEAALGGVTADPQSITRWATQGFQAALSAKEQLPTFQTRNTGGTTDTLAINPVTGQVNVANSVQNTQSPDNAASVAATIRGQNMVDARARETNQQGKTQIVETPQGFVIVDKNTGQSRPATDAAGQPLKGKANDRVMTDAQAKANLFGTRMKESDRILSDLEGKYWPGAVNAKMGAAEVPIVGGVAGYAGNLMLSDSGQQAEQAQRDFINAVLRRESGAVISPAEFSNGQKQYFPQPGDSKAVLEQKRRNRQLAIAGMEAEVPGGFRGAPSLTNPQGGGKVVDFGSLK